MSIKIMIKKKLINQKLILFILAFLTAVPSNVELKQIGKFKDWTAYSEGEGRNLACMAVSKPKKEEGDYKKRGEVFSIISLFFVVLISYHLLNGQVSGPTATVNLLLNVVFSVLFYMGSKK